MRDKILLPSFVIVFGIAMRILPHLPNVTPITAIALFGGMYLDKKYALILPFIIMLASDFFIGLHDTQLFVYLSFFISGLLGIWMRKVKTAGRVLFITLSASTIFFIITNFGVWLVGHIYSKDIRGLLECFTMALPFFRNTIFGDLLYTTSFILLFEFVKYLLEGRLPALANRR